MRLLLALALALVLAVWLAAPMSGRAPGARSYEFLGAKWPDHALPVPYCVNPNGIPTVNGQMLMTADQFVQAVRKAFDTWQNLPDSYIAFEFRGVCFHDPRNTSDGFNTIGWGRLSGSAAGVAALTSSHTTPLRRSLAGDLVEVDIMIDDRTPLGMESQTYLSLIFPVIILHEVGHFLGLGHSQRGCAVMAPSSLQLELCDDDIEGVRILYPGPERARNLDVREVACAGGRVDVTFGWTSSREAEGYVLDVTLDPWFGRFLGVYAGSRGANAVRLSALVPGWPHYWRLWNFGHGLGSHVYGPAFVTPHCFGATPVPAGPAELSLTVSCQAGVVSATFSWSRSLAAEGYFIDLTLDPFFGGWVNAWVAGERTTSISWSGLLPNAPHYWRVYAYNGAGGFHSYPAAFHTPRC